MMMQFLTLTKWLLLVTALITGFILSMLTWSSFELTAADLANMLLNFDSSSMTQQILYTLRLPRTLAAIVIGANLAVAGVLMQGLTRNALASPAILGINAGAACFIALSSIGFYLLSGLPSIIVALLGGLVAGGAVMLLGGFFNTQQNPLRLILAGIAINALLAGVTRASLILADDSAYSVINWLSGSISAVNWDSFMQLLPISLLGLAIALLLAGKMNLLSLGEDVATGLGLNINQTRILACIAIILLTAVSVSIAGPISFVGLLVPHFVRKVFSVDYKWLLPCSALVGACLLLWADGLSRGIAFPAETPVGIITALIGTPCFIFLALQKKSS